MKDPSVKFVEAIVMALALGFFLAPSKIVRRKIVSAFKRALHRKVISRLCDS